MNIKHWTLSSVRGGMRLDQFQIWNMWNNSLYKVKYNDTNWITNGLDSDYVLDDMPFMTTTNKICCLIVDVSKTSTSPLENIRLVARDPDTRDIIIVTHHSTMSSTSIPLSKEYADKKQYLSYTYDIIEFTPSTTYVDDSGVVLKKRILLQVQTYNQNKWTTKSRIGYKSWMKLIEIGPDNLTGGFVFPKIGEPIPDYFLGAWFGLITGDLYDISVGIRYLNYLVPYVDNTDPDSDPTYKIKINFKPDTIFSQMILTNNTWSDIIGVEPYSTLKYISRTANATPEFVAHYREADSFGEYETEADYFETYDMTGYTYWTEKKLIGDDSRQNLVNIDNQSILKDVVVNTTALEIMMNFPSASVLPGYDNTLTNNIMELGSVLPGTQTTQNRLPLDNITFSRIINTLKLPFWKYLGNNDVVDYNKSPNIYSGIGKGYFEMELKMFDDGDTNISDTGLYIKFYV